MIDLNSQAVPKGYYRRIGGRLGRQLGPLPLAISIARVMIGPDHILLIDGGLVFERYHRFYFRDIEAVIVRKTITRVLSLILMLILTALFALPAVFVTDEFARTVLIVCASLTLLLGIIGWFRGPTCACYIRTAVQTARLYPICRMRHTRTLFAALASIRLQGMAPE